MNQKQYLLWLMGGVVATLLVVLVMRSVSTATAATPTCPPARVEYRDRVVTVAAEPSPTTTTTTTDATATTTTPTTEACGPVPTVLPTKDPIYVDSGQYVRVPTGIEATTPFTIEVFGVATGLRPDATLLYLETSGGQMGMTVRQDHAGTGRLTVTVKTDGETTTTTSQDALVALDDWLAVALTIDGDAGFWVAVNGQELVGPIETNQPRTTVKYDVAYLGSDPASPSMAWQGFLGEFRVWKGARNLELLQRHLTLGVDEKDTDLLVLYQGRDAYSSTLRNRATATAKFGEPNALVVRSNSYLTYDTTTGATTASTSTASRGLVASGATTTTTTTDGTTTTSTTGSTTTTAASPTTGLPVYVDQGQYLTVANGFDAPTAWTLEVFALASALTGGSTLVRLSTDPDATTGAYGMSIALDSAGSGRLAATVTCGATTTTLTTQNPVVVAGQWFLLTAVMQAADAMRLFLNGVPLCDAQPLGAPFSPSRLDRVTFGADPSNRNRYWKGYVGEIRWWTGSRAPAQITHDVTHRIDEKDAALLLLYQMKDFYSCYVKNTAKISDGTPVLALIKASTYDLQNGMVSSPVVSTDTTMAPGVDVSIVAPPVAPPPPPPTTKGTT